MKKITEPHDNRHWTHSLIIGMSHNVIIALYSFTMLGWIVPVLLVSYGEHRYLLRAITLLGSKFSCSDEMPSLNEVLWWSSTDADMVLHSELIFLSPKYSISGDICAAGKKKEKERPHRNKVHMPMAAESSPKRSTMKSRDSNWISCLGAKVASLLLMVMLTISV